MRKKQKRMMVFGIVAVCMVAGLFMPQLVGAGDLEPKAPPGPTMKTLDEIYGKLEIIDSKLGGAAPVGKTGQSTSYSAGDDGDLERGVEWPIPRFTDNNDGTVTDELTGLIWMKDANCFGTRTWAGALFECNGLASGSCGLTDGSVAGNWHLPNLRELQSLIDYGEYNPALLSGHPFTDVQSSYYWSSTTYANNTNVAWYMSFSNGAVSYDGKDHDFFVWCVRGGH